MPIGMFKRLIDECIDQGEPIFLGGGEPTIHPNFLEMIGYVLISYKYPVSLVTNGSNTKLTKLLLTSEHINCRVSVDPFHDPIDDEVVALAEKLKRVNRYRQIIPHGRGLSHATIDNECPSEGLFCTPSGFIYSCGCRRKMVGTYEKWHWPYEGCITKGNLERVL